MTTRSSAIAMVVVAGSLAPVLSFAPSLAPRIGLGERSQSLRPCGGRLALRMAGRKDFDKKYDDAFDDFRTSGSMPDIPSISERYGNEAAYVASKGLENDPNESFEKTRLTEAQQELKRLQEMGMESYDELKKDLLIDTLLIGCLLGVVCQTFFGEQLTDSYALGSLGSFGYAFLLTRTADRMGEDPANKSTTFDGTTPARFGLLFVLIIACAKNREYLNILPVLFGFFVPYKLASLRPAIASDPIVGSTEVRIHKGFFDSDDDPPRKVEYGSELKGVLRTNMGPIEKSKKDVKVGSSAPIKRKMLDLDEQYEALKKGTLD